MKNKKVCYFILNAEGVQPMVWTGSNYQRYQKFCNNIFDTENEAIKEIEYRKQRALELGETYYLITKELEVLKCYWHNTIPENNSLCRNEIFRTLKIARIEAKLRQMIKQSF